MSLSDFSGRLPGPVTARPRRPLSNSASTASWSMRFSLLTMISGAPRSSSLFRRLLRLITRRYRSFRSLVAKRPPSSCTIGLSSGGITGTASRIIHSGLFPDLMKASTTLRRLIARCCFCPLEVLIVSRSVSDSCLEVEGAQQVADRLRAHAALEVHAEAVRRAEAVLELPEDLLVADDHLRLELPEQEPRLLEAADRVDRGLARVLAADVHVRDHLADLQRPLPDRVEILLARSLDEAEVVRELADRSRVRLRAGSLEDGAEQAVRRLRARARGSSCRRTRRARRPPRRAGRPRAGPPGAG